MRRLAIVGISGRMGTEIRALATEFKLQVTGGVSTSGKSAEIGAKVVRSVGELDSNVTDVVIDFSLPEATPEVLDWCVRNKIPLVSGVTGINENHKDAFRKAGAAIPILWAPNMSLGVAVVARMLAHFAELQGFDFQIEELHHIRKKDKPSGTALFLQDKLTDAVKKPVPEPLAIRGGGIFGIHRIWAMSEEETITLEHNAMNRRVFARGALRAASWLIGRTPGLYRMDDVLS